MNPSWPVTADLLADELNDLQKIITRWRERFTNEAWLQELDALPEEERAQHFRQFSNEMKVVASKSATVVEVIQ